MKTATLRHSYKKLAKKQAIESLLNNKIVGAFNTNKGYGYIIDDFNEIIENAPNKDVARKIIELNLNNLIYGGLLTKSYNFFEVI